MSLDELNEGTCTETRRCGERGIGTRRVSASPREILTTRTMTFALCSRLPCPSLPFPFVALTMNYARCSRVRSCNIRHDWATIPPPLADCQHSAKVNEPHPCCLGEEILNVVLSAGALPWVSHTFVFRCILTIPSPVFADSPLYAVGDRQARPQKHQPLGKVE